MQVVSAASTELFVGPPGAPLQLARVTVSGCTDETTIRIDGDGLNGKAVAEPGAEVVEVPVTVDHPIVGQRRSARVRAGALSSLSFEFSVAEPGWTMFMVSHFHYDPVWWNTQGAYTSEWCEDPPGRARQNNGFALVHAHLEMARREPEYKFVLAEVDYLKPYWDARPEDRADLRRFLAEGRVEVMGGTYNEPNTNLTSPETTIRNLVHGIGFQRDVLGADPATAWLLDVFGHDPQFPGMAADAGLTSSSWARGPHHQWGPAQGGDVDRMQFSSEFEWISPSGAGLLTHYMPAHYSAGWWMDSSTSLTEAEEETRKLFEQLKKVALTRNVLLPVGTDYTPPNKWVTAIHRDWAARYTWPRFVCGLPREFFAAVRAELAERGPEQGGSPSPQTRDMNPIYTGKDVSYIDTKQANRAAENAVLDAERFAVFAGLITGAEYPQAAFAKAWVQLAYGAHHDAITGSESDQVYLDLLTGWRDAWELGCAARDNSLALLSSAVTGAQGDVIVWNPLTQRRTDVVTARLDPPLQAGVRVLDPDGGRGCPHTSSTTAARSPGWPAMCRRWAGGPTGWYPPTSRPGGNRHPGPRSPTSTTGWRSTRPAAARSGRWFMTVVSSSPKARWETNSPSTRSTRRTRHRGRALGTCCPRGRWSARRNRAPKCGPTTGRWVSAWSCTAGSARCCATPRRSRCGAAWRGWTAAPPSTTSPGRTACCGCAGHVRCRAVCRSARWATPSSGAGSRCCMTDPNRWTPRSTCGRWTTRPTAGSGCPPRRGFASAKMSGPCRSPRWCRRRRRCPGRWRAT